MNCYRKEQQPFDFCIFVVQLVKPQQIKVMEFRLLILKLAMNIIVSYFSSFVFCSNRDHVIAQNQLLFIKRS